MTDTTQNHLTNLKTLVRERSRRERALTEDPELLNIICAHIAAGGTLITLCEIWDVSFGRISVWINKDKERQRQMQDAYQSRKEWAVEKILHELRMLAHVDIRRIMNADGGVLPVEEWPPDLGRALESIDVQEVWGSVGGGEKMQTGVIKKVKFASKLKALELLGKTEALFIERHQVTQAMTLQDLVDASWRDVSDPLVKGPTEK